MSGAYPELLADLASRAEQLLRAEGLGEEQAKTIAFKLSESVRQHWGGQLIYVPMGTDFEITQRDVAMWEKFDGRNHEALAREFGMSLQHVYRVVKKMGRIARARDQRDLFAGAAVVSSAPSGNSPS
ncbi:MAG: Mor transcription activator family protein [Burkholderiales bacterium]|nr:Mor transcription activator family protein [Burkholderiales bacterium]